MEKVFNLENGHAIKVENADREIENDYKITFFEDGKKLDEELCNKCAARHTRHLREYWKK